MDGQIQAGSAIGTTYNRSWDCCGILMNALYTSLDFSWDDFVVTSVTNQWNTTVYHTEAPPSRGWYLDWQQLFYDSGCLGCSSLRLRGQAGFGYQGVFDPSGTLFYNTYDNTMTGYANGAIFGTYSVTWRNSAPGWHVQQWYAYGCAPDAC